MAKIIVLADDSAHSPAPVMFSERVVAENLGDYHYAQQLLERLGWAAADAEEIELRSPRISG